MKSTLSDLDMSVRLGAFVMANFLMYAWTRYVVAPARVGWPRLVLSTFLTPLIFLLCILFDQDKNDEFTAAAYCLCNFLWLTPLKIYSFCMNRGQLVKAYDCGSNAAFAVGLLLPVAVAFDAKPVPKEAEDEAKKRHAYRDARFAVVRYKEGARKEALLQFTYAILEFAFMVFLRYARNRLADAGQMFLSDFCIGWYVYGYTTFVEAIVSLCIRFTANMKLEPSFNRPWLAQSVKELWAIRYNLTFAKTLRNFAYDPIYEGSWIAGPRYFDHKKASKPRRRTALFSTFVLSGIMHMVFSRAICTPSWPYLHGGFFVLNGIVVLLEDILKPMVTSWNLGSRILNALPSLVFTLYVFATLTILNHLLFWTELEACDYRRRFINGGLALLPEDTWLQ